MMDHVRQQSEVRSTSADGTDYFKLRVAGQRFMNENRAIFEAFARSCDDPAAVAERGDLAAAITASTNLAIAVARRFSGVEKPTPTMISPFRAAAAQIVAFKWEHGGLLGFDPAPIAEQHAAAFKLVDETLDRNLFQDLDLSGDASLAMTIASITHTLMKAVMVYDFRRPKEDLLASMTAAVFDVAHSFARRAAPNAKPDDYRSVLQTSANGLAGIMAGVYERKVRQVVARIGGLSEDERDAYAQGNDPLPEILNSFHELGVLFVGTAFAAGRQAATPSPTPVDVAATP